MISAKHLPGKLNTMADQESRLKGDSSEWMLDPVVFARSWKLLVHARYRRICIKVIGTAPEIHELETRPGLDCIEPILEGDQGVCLPTILPDWEVPLESQEGESVRAESGGSCLANTTMVCSPVVDAVPKSTHSSKVPIPVEESSQRTSSIDTPVESRHVASVRNSLQGQGISGAASSLILSSW